MGEFARAGATIKSLAPIEGMYLTTSSGNVALINRAPHPDAAVVFINWLLSREGQRYVSEAQLIHSARLDVPTDYLDAGRIRNPQVKYLDSQGEDFHLRGPQFAAMAREIFGQYIR